MQVGILGGTGPAGQALGTRLSAAGVDVVLGSRSIERGEEVAAALRSTWSSRSLTLIGADNSTAASCEIVVLATPWEGAIATAGEVSDALAGKTLVSMVNALARMGREFQALIPARGSMAATIQAALPRTNVAAAFQHLPARELGAIGETLEADVFVCADERGAGDETIALVEKMEGLRGVYAGSLASANAVEALTAVLLNINVRYKTHVAPRLSGFSGTEVQ